jgi:hypothetical protein
MAPLKMCTTVIGSTTGPSEVNVVSPYPDKRQNHRDSEGGGHEKDICRGREVADNTYDSGCRQATDRGEALIATEPFGERLLSN